MNKDKYIIIGLIIFCITLIGFIDIFLTPNDNLNSNNKNIIGELDASKKSYGHPYVKLVYCDNLTITIDGGIYRFGDIDQDGMIGYSDFETLKDMITVNNYNYTKNKKRLADVNEDGIIDNNDLRLLNNYLKKNKEVEYDAHEELLMYCLSEVSDSNNCIWQESPNFKISIKKDYYAFVKHKQNGNVSESMLVSKNIIK